MYNHRQQSGRDTFASHPSVRPRRLSLTTPRDRLQKRHPSNQLKARNYCNSCYLQE